MYPINGVTYAQTMSKQRRSFTLDPKVAEWLKENDSINASALVNQYLHKRRQGVTHKEAVTDALIEEREAEIQETRFQINRLESKIDRLEREIETLTMGDDYDDDVRDMAERFVEDVDIDRIDLEPTNPAVENYAGKAGTSPKQFLRVVDHIR